MSDRYMHIRLLTSELNKFYAGSLFSILQRMWNAQYTDGSKFVEVYMRQNLSNQSEF